MLLSSHQLWLGYSVSILERACAVCVWSTEHYWLFFGRKLTLKFKLIIVIDMTKACIVDCKM
jgi:hypothetical protein